MHNEIVKDKDEMMNILRGLAMKANITAVAPASPAGQQMDEDDEAKAKEAKLPNKNH